MKKILVFVAVILLIVLAYIILFNKKMSYKLDYEVNDYKVTEEYDLKNNFYTFNVKDNDNNYTFMLDKKYSTKRKLIREVLLDSFDKYNCISIKVDNKYIPYVCKNGALYVDKYVAGNKKEDKENKINTINKIDIYNNNNDYYIWNGYGITNVLTSKKYNFLKKENYDNQLSYSYKDYIVFANYDDTREYSKFYLFNNKAKDKLQEIPLDTNISMDSYFNGVIDDEVYIFDKKNKNQFKINLKNKKVTLTSSLDSAIYYNEGIEDLRINDFVYENKLFKNISLINFYIKDNKLYYKYYNSDYPVLIDNREVKDIIKIDDDKVYYLVGTSLYSYDLYNGPIKLMECFEWNFSYKNKLFIF